MRLVRQFSQNGKDHQIRVHLTHIGHPLAVDPIYGSSAGLLLSQFKRGYRPKPDEDERPLINRLTLRGEVAASESLDGSRRNHRATEEFSRGRRAVGKARKVSE